MEEVHHHPDNTQCDCCHGEMIEIGTTIAREEAKFVPATMKRVQHIEHAYECRHCKRIPHKKHKSKEGKHRKLSFSEALQDRLF